MTYVFYSLWGKFYVDERYYNKLLTRKHIIINISISILLIVLGILIDSLFFKIKSQTSIYFIPFCFIIILNLFNRLSNIINKRQFYSIRSSVDMESNYKDFIDLFFTMMIIISSLTLPLIIWMLIEN